MSTTDQRKPNPLPQIKPPSKPKTQTSSQHPHSAKSPPLPPSLSASSSDGPYSSLSSPHTSSSSESPTPWPPSSGYVVPSPARSSNPSLATIATVAPPVAAVAVHSSSTAAPPVSAVSVLSSSTALPYPHTFIFHPTCKNQK
ncbi:hypothetical protein LINGRAHAP2_LOCUS24973 [Linum grandiflorum]